MRLLRPIGLLLILAVAGCATVGGPSPQQLSQARQARAMEAQGRFADAAQAYLNLADQSEGGADYFRLRAAEAWRDGGDLDHAARILQNVTRKRLSSGDRARFDLMQAEIALAHGNSARALKLTAAVHALPPDLQLRASELRARALAQSGRPFAAARLRVGMDAQLQGLDQADNRRQIVKLLMGMGAPALQQRAGNLADDDPMQRWVGEVLAQMGVAAARPAPELDHPVGTLLPGSSVQQGYKAPTRIALLLPASGPLAPAAKVIREGFFTGYFNHHGDDSGARPPVRSYDTGTSAASALAAYHKAVADGAGLVVGPLSRDAVAALLKQAPLPVPVLALNHPDQDGLPPPHVTEFGLQPETEGVEVADHMRQQGIRQALIFVTSEDFAQRAGRAFATQFTADGGKVLQTITLDPSAVDYSDQLKGLDPDKLAKAGVFVSMRPFSARLLLPQLHLAKLDLPVFATSHVYAGSDDPDDDGDLDGVEFCDAPWLFDAQPGLPARGLLEQSLPSVRTGSGARLFALGMDAWALAPYLDWLRDHPGSYLAGATGQLAEDDFGRIRRALIWVRFHNGIARPVSGSLEAGTPSSSPVAPATSASSPAPATSSPTAPAGQGGGR